MRRWLAAAILVGAVGACGPLCGNGKLNLANAHIQAAYTCPLGSSQSTYNVTGSVDADNQTGSTVTIKSMSLTATVLDIGTRWGAPVGSKSTVSDFPFNPKSINSGSKTTIKFSSPWNCSDPEGNTGSYADFSI